MSSMPDYLENPNLDNFVFNEKEKNTEKTMFFFGSIVFKVSGCFFCPSLFFYCSGR